MERGDVFYTIHFRLDMADNKKGIVVYADWGDTLDSLEDDEAGRLIKHFFNYVRDKNPAPPDRLTQLLFEPWKSQLKRDLIKWKAKCDKNRENVGVRWNKKDTIEYERKKPDTKHTDTDNDTVTDTDNDTDIKKKEAVRENVYLHRKEIEKLQTQYSSDDLNWIFDKLSAYKLSKGKTYKSDYGAINNWVADRLKEKNSEKKENGTKTEGTIESARNILIARGINPDKGV